MTHNQLVERKLRQFTNEWRLSIFRSMNLISEKTYTDLFKLAPFIKRFKCLK